MVLQYQKVEYLQKFFGNFDEWYNFSSSVCDDYVKYFLLRDFEENNIFKLGQPTMGFPFPNYERPLRAFALTFSSFSGAE